MIPSLSARDGGPSRALALMEQVLAAQDVLVETVTTDDAGPGRCNGKPLGVALTENGVTRRYFRKVVDFYKVSPALAWWALRHVRGYDVVHIHALFSFTSIAVAFAARRAKVPYVLRPLGTLTQYGVSQRRPWLKRLSLAFLEGPALRQAAAVHFTSDGEQREAGRLGIPMRGAVIPLGIEASQPASPHLVRQRFKMLSDDRYVLYLSRLDPKKNVESLLRAFSICAPGLPQVKLLIAGDGQPSYVAELKALADRMGLGDCVVWAGHIEGALKASALAGADLFVLPSFSENFGIAAAEALMAGRPCIVGTGVAIAQDIQAAGAGLAVPPNPASIAEALMRIMTEATTCSSMSVRAVELAHTRYSAGAMGKELFCLYSDILSRTKHDSNARKQTRQEASSEFSGPR